MGNSGCKNGTCPTALLNKAREAMGYAYAPYSNFRVGAAISTKDGKIWTGCNIENVSSGLTICAERVAILKAISEGYPNFEWLVIVADDLTYPCGACRQVLKEFVVDLKITLVDGKGNTLDTSLGKLFPFPFSL